MVLTYSGSVYDQGVFAVVNNLGSLVVRILFQPIEEGTAHSFAGLAGSKNSQNREKTRPILNVTLQTVSYVGTFCFTLFSSNTHHSKDFILHHLARRTHILLWISFTALSSQS